MLASVSSICCSFLLNGNSSGGLGKLSWRRFEREREIVSELLGFLTWSVEN